MNYIWNALLRADENELDRNKIKFVPAEICSPYMEISLEDINLTSLPENNVIEVNQCYRFYEIFKDLFNINLEEGKELREVFLDIVLHYLGKLDLKSGLCKNEFYKKFLMKDILNGLFGEGLKNNIKIFTKNEIEDFLEGLITLYSTGNSIYLFNKILRKIFKNSIVYINKDKPKEIYIYLGEKFNFNLKTKIEMLIDTFLPINMTPLIFWDKHFGILEYKETMKIDQIVMVE